MILREYKCVVALATAGMPGPVSLRGRCCGHSLCHHRRNAVAGRLLSKVPGRAVRSARPAKVARP